MVVSSESGGCVGGVLADGGDDSRRLRDGRRLDRMGAVMSGLALYLPRRSRFIPEITDRGQEHTGAGAQRLGLWRRSETAPLLEREGICL